MPSKLRISINTIALYFENIVNTGIAIIVIYCLSRYLGPEAFGKLNFVISFVLLFLAMFEFGVGQITIRELAKYPDKKDKLMGTAMLLKIILGILSFISCWTIYLLGQYDKTLLIGLLIYSARLVFSPINLSMTIYRLDFTNHVSALINIFFKCVYLLLTYLTIALKLPLTFVFCSLAFTEIMTDVLRSLLLKKTFSYRLNYDWDLMKEMLRESWPLGLSVVCIALYMRINMVLLPKMVDYYQIGIYSAADRIIQILFFIPQNLSLVLFPLFAIHSTKDTDKAKRLLLKSFDYLGISAVVLCSMLFVYNKILVSVLFGHKFEGCEEIVQISLFQLFFVFAGIPLGNYLIAMGKQKINLVNDFLAFVVNLGLFLVLTPKWGIKGTAYAALGTKIFLTLFVYLYFIFVLKIRIRLLPIFLSFVLIALMFWGLTLVGCVYNVPAVALTLGLYLLILIKAKTVNLEDFLGKKVSI